MAGRIASSTSSLSIVNLTMHYCLTTDDRLSGEFFPGMMADLEVNLIKVLL